MFTAVRKKELDYIFVLIKLQGTSLFLWIILSIQHIYLLTDGKLMLISSLLGPHIDVISVHMYGVAHIGHAAARSYVQVKH